MFQQLSVDLSKTATICFYIVFTTFSFKNLRILFPGEVTEKSQLRNSELSTCNTIFRLYTYISQVSLFTMVGDEKSCEKPPHSGGLMNVNSRFGG
jgi:hypothetical protein